MEEVVEFQRLECGREQGWKSRRSKAVEEHKEEIEGQKRGRRLKKEIEGTLKN